MVHNKADIYVTTPHFTYRIIMYRYLRICVVYIHMYVCMYVYVCDSVAKFFIYESIKITFFLFRTQYMCNHWALRQPIQLQSPPISCSAPCDIGLYFVALVCLTTNSKSMQFHATTHMCFFGYHQPIIIFSSTHDNTMVKAFECGCEKNVVLWVPYDCV